MRERDYYSRLKERIKKVLHHSLIFLFLGVSLFSCTRYVQQPVGIWHELMPGETLEQISKQYSVSVLDIKRANDIYDPQDLSPGMTILIPAPPGAKSQEPVTKREPDRITKAKFSWPSQGTISSGFGLRHGQMHEGIDITKDKGRDVRAAGSGIVEFAGKKNGYGNTIIINHGSGYKTLYAHNLKLYAKKGMKVTTGAIISRMGSSGNSSGIHLHFEVRYHGKPQNPLRYLPVR